jgi:hypothetical protein
MECYKSAVGARKAIDNFHKTSLVPPRSPYRLPLQHQTTWFLFGSSLANHQAVVLLEIKKRTPDRELSFGKPLRVVKFANDVTD